MADVKMIMNGPATFEMVVFLVNDETGQTAKATVGIGAFEYPTKSKVAAKMEELAAGELENFAPGFRLMDKREAFNAMVRDRTGEQEVEFATPGGPEWDAIGSSEGTGYV